MRVCISIVALCVASQRIVTTVRVLWHTFVVSSASFGLGNQKGQLAANDAKNESTEHCLIFVKGMNGNALVLVTLQLNAMTVFLTSKRVETIDFGRRGQPKPMFQTRLLLLERGRESARLYRLTHRSSQPSTHSFVRVFVSCASIHQPFACLLVCHSPLWRL